MKNSRMINENSDSLIGLLAAQCSDLENLLELSRRETAAAEMRDFEAVLDIVTERAAIGTRLETFQRQIAELRGFIGGHENKTVTARIAELADMTIAQDRKTMMLMSAIRAETADNLAHLDAGKRSTSVYLRSESRGMSYDMNF